MKYLKLFLTTLLYNNYAADELNFILPNVSLCDDVPTIVYFNPLKLSINPIVSMANWTYGLTSSEPVVSGNLGNGEVTYYYKLLSENSWSTTKPSNAGSYNVRADIAETEDYLSGTCQGTFIINKATPTVIAPTAKSNLVYNGSSQLLINAGSTNMGTMKYSIDNSTWSTSVPTAINAGNYNIYYKVEGNSNVNNINSTLISGTSIARANRTISFTSAPTEVYEGDTIIVSASPSAGSGDGTITFSSSDISIATVSGSTITGISTGTVTITATISQGTNYNSASTSYSLSVLAPYVEIAGIKWAKKNFGAFVSETEYGLYFSWGDTQCYPADEVSTRVGGKHFNWEEYKYGNGTNFPGEADITKYNNTDGKMVLEGSDDIVTVNMGNEWRMPTKDEFIALRNATTSVWTADYQGSGVAGLVCTDKTDNSKVLFFPAAGRCAEGYVESVGDQGFYWTSSLKDDGMIREAYEIDFYSNRAYWDRTIDRSYGLVTRPIYDPYNGHDYVEIGGLKWATMNVGANSITDTGLYFQWGDTQGYTASQCGSGSGKKYFAWADYKYGNGTSSPGNTGMTKYNSTDGKTVLDISDDAARVNMGGQWRMPTKDEYVVLGNAVNTAWTADYQGSGVAGLVCTDKTDSSKTLFFPAAGFCGNGSVKAVGNCDFYWSSSLYTNSRQYAYNLYFDSDYAGWDSYYDRCYGYAVRGVVD